MNEQFEELKREWWTRQMSEQFEVTLLEIEEDTIAEIARNPGAISHLYMDRATANEKLEQVIEEELELWKAGQKEYARSPNIFANFTRLAETLGTTPEKILMVYATKHLDGIISWINGYKSQREDVRGRINDLRVYLAILYLMVEVYEGAKE